MTGLVDTRVRCSRARRVAIARRDERAGDGGGRWSLYAKVWAFVYYAVCAGLVLANAIIYFKHPRGHGLNLFAGCFLGAVVLVALACEWVWR